MWRIADHDSEIWLFGTVHMLPADVEWRSAQFEAAFAASDVVILEVDLNHGQSERIHSLTMQLGYNANFVSLSSLLTPNENARLANAASKVGILPDLLEPLRPWLASIQLTLLNMAGQGYDSATGVDANIASMAQAAGKRLAYLETVEDQFAVFASLSAKVEKAFLMATVEQIAANPGTLNELIQAWATGDTKKFSKYFKDMRGDEMPGLHDALFVRRNKAWVEQIAKRMKGAGKAFIAVGAGHLPGQDGVVSLLRARGIRVKRL